MNLLEQQLNYPFNDTLVGPGQTLEVAPGIKWVRMPLPFALDHINLWLLKDAIMQQGQLVTGWTLIDCGIHQDKVKVLWEQIFANELEGLPILRVIVTHMHPDHIGLADWICQRFNAPLLMSGLDYHVARLACQDQTSFGGDGAALFFYQHGIVSAQDTEKIKARVHYYSSLVPSVPKQYQRLLDSQKISIGLGTEQSPTRSWKLISGFGHAPEHMALYCEISQILISGDMVLPRISTNVSVYDSEPLANPLALFLDSIDLFRACADSTLTLPSHGKPFTGLVTRIQQLHDHHQERLEELLVACQIKPLNAVEAIAVLFKRELDFHQTTFALGEAVAHLHYLWHKGALERQQDAQGNIRFSAIKNNASIDLPSQI